MTTRSSRTFLRTSLIIAFVPLTFAFAQVFSLFSVRLLSLLLPKVAASWPAVALTWVLAAAASLTVCRMILRRAPEKTPSRPPAG